MPKENRVKRMGCREKRLSREEGPKKKRCQKIRTPRGRDVNGKRLKKHRFQKTAMTSENQFQERRVCQVSGFRAVNMKGCKDSEMSGASRIKRKWQHQTICRGQNMSRTKGFKRSRSQRCASQAATSYTPSLFFIAFSPLKTSVARLPGLYLQLIGDLTEQYSHLCAWTSWTGLQVPRFQKVVSDNSELRLTTSTQKGSEMELHNVMDATEAIRSPT